jgi:hypothetical protein
MRSAIEMAKEAGFMLRAESVKGQSDWWECFDEAIEKLVALARADEREAAQAEHEADKVIIEYHEAAIRRLEAGILAEREACAKICDELANDENTDEYINAANWCSVRIRARGKT